MRKIWLPILLSGLLWSACSKPEVPVGGFETPIFWLSFGVDSLVSSKTAGVDGTYLFTSVDRGADGVLVMSGAFTDADCPNGNCPGSIRFEFRNDQAENFVTPGELFRPDQEWAYKSPLSDSLALHTVAIQWVTPEGNVLRSDLIPQPSDTFFMSKFRILNSEPWEKNERGESTWKMELFFTSWLFDTLQGQERRITGSGVIAVGYR